MKNNEILLGFLLTLDLNQIGSFITKITFMFSVIYSFEVKPDSIIPFVTAWKKMTVLLYTREGSLGSRLHKVDETKYIAYAQWPDKETWAKQKVNLPKSANEYHRIMNECCTSIKTEYAMEMVEDLLKN